MHGHIILPLQRLHQDVVSNSLDVLKEMKRRSGDNVSTTSQWERKTGWSMNVDTSSCLSSISYLSSSLDRTKSSSDWRRGWRRKNVQLTDQALKHKHQTVNAWSG